MKLSELKNAMKTMNPHQMRILITQLLDMFPIGSLRGMGYFLDSMQQLGLQTEEIPGRKLGWKVSTPKGEEIFRIYPILNNEVIDKATVKAAAPTTPEGATLH